MKTSHGILLSVGVLLMICFMVFGYAALTDHLYITGSAEAQGRPFQGVYIKEVALVSSSNITSINNDFILPTNHTTDVLVGRSNGTITYRITVHNNTDVTYWYIGPKYASDYGNNMLIGKNNGISITTKDQLSDNYQTFNSEDWIPPQTERDFYVTYTYGANTPANSSTLVNFYFDIHMDAVYDEFLVVINDTTVGGGYETLAGVLNQVYASSGATSISSKTHPELFASMFSDLMVNIDGVEREATVLIRRENLDGDDTTGDKYSGNGPGGCEYTLYITVEALTPGTRPVVYAISYSEGAEAMGDSWYQVGELYEGTALVDSNGNIDYKSWIATHKTYEIADGISYIVGAQNGDQYDIMKTMEQLISAEDQDIFNQIDNTNIFKKVYDIIQKHPNSTDPAVIGLREAFYEAEKFYVNHNNGQEFKVVRNKYTRAEIIYALQNIQMALDYYNQVYTG